MELKLWHTIVSACGEVRQMLDGKGPSVAPEAQASDATIFVKQSVEVKGSLRNEIRAKLDELRIELAKVLSEREVYFVLFPLTVHYDELVLRRLPPNDQTAWPLLQSERFGINDGGDKFYSFADERLANPDTPPLVFEVLYFCLSDGFIGRYANDPARIAGYKSNLAARIPTPKTPLSTGTGRARRGVAGDFGIPLSPPVVGGGKMKGSGQGTSTGSASGTSAGRTAHPSPLSPTADGAAQRKAQSGRLGGPSGASGAASGPLAAPRSEGSSRGAFEVGLFYVAAAMVVILMPLVLVWLSNL